ncbi:unnamed protein product [Blepharisma stoltei]|uniref:protein-disulfide reductase n=1 Tax=Blepharisma stoltei TaxID=1481888 RepID=A0AAU9JGI6_9CILI|nr:unnamed protein product [Blepharisma stoltei]
MDKLLGNKFITRDSEKTFQDLSKDAVITLYFSAHWCPPCKSFTPKYSQVFNAVNNEEKRRLEVIFVSLDRDQEEMLEYLESCPFMALPFSDKKRIEYLCRKFQVTGIPLLVVLNKDGSVASMDGRGDVMRLREGVVDYWEKLINHPETVTLEERGGAVSFKRFRIGK